MLLTLRELILKTGKSNQTCTLQGSSCLSSFLWGFRPGWFCTHHIQFYRNLLNIAWDVKTSGRNMDVVSRCFISKFILHTRRNIIPAFPCVCVRVCIHILITQTKTILIKYNLLNSPRATHCCLVNNWFWIVNF